MVDLVDTMIDSNAVGALTDFVNTLGTHDRVAALPGLSGCEVLVLAGDADRIIPYRHSEAIADALPTARLVRLPGVGHMPMLEQPDRVDAEISDLLDAAWSARAAAGSGSARRGTGRRPGDGSDEARPTGIRSSNVRAATGTSPAGSPRRRA